MIRFHTLGALELRTADGRELRAVLQQPKRLGLLAYLTVATPRRFHRRDSLLALFWPDLDQEHARAALRRALYFLRTELGGEVVAGRGDDEVGVPEESLWCDATALEAAHAAKNHLDTVRLYRGPLLDGLYVAGAASELQDWLDRERLRLRDRAAGAARALHLEAETAGRTREAITWAVRALELAPDDEATLRRYLLVLDRSGDRAAALRAYEEFARRLASELELEPSAETRALADTLRARQERVPAPAAAAAPAPGPAAPRLTSEHAIAVLPFAIHGDLRLAYLREGLVDLLATKLEGAGDVRTVDPRALLHYVACRGTDEEGSPDVDGSDVAHHFGAGRYLAGSLLEAGSRLLATASLYEADGAPVASVQATAGDEGELFELVDELARQLLAARGVAEGSRGSRLGALTTSSLGALKAYLQGERELRAGRYFDALERFQAAVDADDTFALAHYRLAASAAGCALADVARAAADRGAAYQARLSPHDRLVFAAQRAWLRGQVDRAESLYNTVTGTYPDDVEAWFHLGDLLFHSNPLRGRTAAEAREPFERVLGLEPDHLGAQVHLVRISAIEGRTAEMLDRAARVVALSPEGDQALAMRALSAFATRDAATADAVTRDLQHARAITVAIAFADVALYAHDLDGAERLARSFIQVARAAELRALCHILIAHLAFADGRPNAAVEALKRAEALDATWGLEMRALFATLPFVAPDEAELRELRDALERWDPSAAVPSLFVLFAMHNDLHPAIRLYLLGLIEVRLGELGAAAQRVEALAELEPAGGSLVRHLTVELDAAIAWARGRPAEALARLERTPAELWFQLTVASPFFSLASQRFLRARLLEAVGRGQEALGWYRSIAERSPYELIYARAAGEAAKRLAAEPTR